MDALANTNPPPQQFQVTGTYMIIYLIWFMWFANQALILIILLNFLIAVVSQSYENVMNSAMQFKYIQRCELIREAAIINQQFGIYNEFHVFILQADTSAGGSGDWAGFVQTLKTFIKGETSKIIKANLRT